MYAPPQSPRTATTGARDDLRTTPPTGTVLVVDDEVGPRESLRLILTPEFDVRVAADGSEAIELFDEVRPDVVLSDIRMPHMDGVELLKAIRERSSDVPFILITGYASLDSAKEALRCGAFDYVNKPYNVRDIREIVVRALGAAERTAERERITEHLQSVNEELEGQIREMDKRAAAGDLSAEVIHDLSNPICALQGYVEMLEYALDERTKHGDAEERELLTNIKNDAQRCIDLIRNFLNYVRPSGEGTRTSVDLNSLLPTVLSLFRTRLRRRSIELETDFAANLPKVTAEPVPLQQVFHNLIANACQAMEQDAETSRRHLRIETRTAVDDNGQNAVVARVSDTGPGIPPELQERVFERFFTTRPKNEGTGLGLAICERIVADHNGTLSLESTTGEGTVFTVSLPAASPPT